MRKVLPHLTIGGLLAAVCLGCGSGDASTAPGGSDAGDVAKPNVPPPAPGVGVPPPAGVPRAGTPGPPPPADEQFDPVAMAKRLQAELKRDDIPTRGEVTKAISYTRSRNIGVALSEYAEKNGHYPPPANYDESGQPLLSWRVHLLPYLAEHSITRKEKEIREIYGKFHLDEPWDSPHNKQLVPLIPVFYQSGGRPVDGTTCFQAIVGPQTVFGSRDGMQRSQLRTDGTSNTLIVVETAEDRAVPWTQPADWQFRPGAPTAGLGGLHGPLFVAIIADGACTYVRSSVDPQLFRALVQVGDGSLDRWQDRVKP